MNTRIAHFASRAIACSALAALPAILGGCVERKLVIGSDPPGTLLMLNDQEIGRTPATVHFLTYGDYDIRLRLEKNVGTAEKPDIKHYYLHTHKTTVMPWFETIPMDLIAELLPIQFKDEQVWAFPVPEVKEPPDSDLLQRAKELQGQLGK